jgi:uncharacterized protein
MNTMASAFSMNVSKQRMAQLCRRHHIARLAVFGSALRDDFGSDSDVDVLVEFEPGRTPGLGMMDVEDDLSELFDGHHADIVNPKYLNARMKTRVLAEAQVQYDADA